MQSKPNDSPGGLSLSLCVCVPRLLQRAGRGLTVSGAPHRNLFLPHRATTSSSSGGAWRSGSSRKRSVLLPCP